MPVDPNAQGAKEGAPPVSDPEDAAQALLSELTVGTVVDGKYKIDEVLGRGAMGVVVAATHSELGERVALKFLRYQPKAGGTDDFQTRFKREARVSARLKNEHITRVIDVGVWRARVPYMVMDYLHGHDLRQVIKSGVQIPVAMAIDYTVQVCEGIAEAHEQNIVHRDLKPSNLFVTRRPDGTDLMKILDFGISKWTPGEAEVEELTQTGVVLGSPKYMAPEQLFGSAEVDARADVWSIGAILYEMLCGRPPFDMPTFTKICAELATDHMPPSLVARRPEVTPELEKVVMKCFLRPPAERMQNVADLAGELLEAVQAPFAQAMRARIAATLGARAGKDGLSISGPLSMSTSGSFSSVLSQSSGSHPAITRSSGNHPVISSSGSHPGVAMSPLPPSGPESTSAPTTASQGAPAAAPRRSVGVWVALGAVIVLGGIGGVAVYGSSKEDPAKAATTGTGAPPPVAAAAPQAPPSATSTTANPVASAPPASESASAASTTASAPPNVAPVLNRGGWRPHPRPVPQPQAAAAPPPPAAAAPPPPAPTPTAPAAPPRPAADPLGDRQ